MPIRITDRIYLVQGDNGGRFPYSHSLYIDDRVRTVIDTGMGEAALADIPAAEVDLVLLSHFHPDHIRLTSRFSAARVLAHPLDIPPVESARHFLTYTGFDLLGPEQADAVLNLVGYRPSMVDGSFLDGDQISLGETTLQVIHTPGHSPGHCCFYAEREGVLFLADIDLTSFGPWYGHLVCDVDLFLSSLDRVGGLAPEIILTSHAPPATSGFRERLMSYRNQILHRDAEILVHLDQPRNEEELADLKLCYRRFPEPEWLYRHFERMMIGRHLARLVRQGKVVKDGSRFVRAEAKGHD